VVDGAVVEGAVVDVAGAGGSGAVVDGLVVEMEGRSVEGGAVPPALVAGLAAPPVEGGGADVADPPVSPHAAPARARTTATTRKRFTIEQRTGATQQ